MNVERFEVGSESRERALEGAHGNGAKRHAEAGAKGWVGIGLGVGAAVALAVLRTKSNGPRARALTLASAAVTGATLVNTLFFVRRRGLLPGKSRTVSARSAVTIRRSRDDIYGFWRDLKNLAVFMRHVSSVSETNGHSVWHAVGPAGTRAEWEAEIVADRPGERIAWRSLEGAAIPNHGSVEFRDAPRGQGTEVRLELVFEPPGGSVGASIARLFAELPEQSMKGDLRRLKQLLETGEIVCSDASIHRGPHPARPPASGKARIVNGMVQS